VKPFLVVVEVEEGGGESNPSETTLPRESISAARSPAFLRFNRPNTLKNFGLKFLFLVRQFVRDVDRSMIIDPDIYGNAPSISETERTAPAVGLPRLGFPSLEIQMDSTLRIVVDDPPKKTSDRKGIDPEAIGRPITRMCHCYSSTVRV
jgi:hypothetical protein